MRGFENEKWVFYREMCLMWVMSQGNICAGIRSLQDLRLMQKAELTSMSTITPVNPGGQNTPTHQVPSSHS